MHPFALDHTSTVYSAPLQVVAATWKSAETSQEIPIVVRSARNFSVSLSEPSHHSRSIKTHRTKRLWVESRAVRLLRGFFPLRRGASLVDAPPQPKKSHKDDAVTHWPDGAELIDHQFEPAFAQAFLDYAAGCMCLCTKPEQGPLNSETYIPGFS